MRKIKSLNIEQEEKDFLFDVVYGKNKDDYEIEVQTICEILWLCADGDVNINDILMDIDVSRRTIFNYIAKYREDKRFMFNQKYRKVRSSELKKYEDIIIDNLNKNPIKTYKEAKERIKKITGIDRSITQIKEFLDYCKFKKKNGFYIQKKKKYLKKSSYFHEHINEITEFLENSTPNSMDMALRMLRKEFPLIEETDSKLKPFIEKHTSL